MTQTRTPTNALIVSHGQPSEPEVAEAEIRALARAVAAHLPEWQIEGATLAADGALEAALERVPGAIVYPMFMADGWFTQTALPRRLGDHAGAVLPPFGLDAGLPQLAADWLMAEVAAKGWAARDVSVFVSGHGSGRSPRPAEVTRDFAATLGGVFAAKEIRCGFVEEAPYLADVAAGLGAMAVSLPFFAARRGHVLDDLPEALEAVGFAGLRLDPIGLHPRVPEMIANSLRRA
ncbi:sirohydrochlorin chelatase [Pseudoprimorskyibacter insulae]|uniref:Sirohydrochlorin ferrochelatase n=1 Tax=Pseudoprimorskyibacter insulae TaxID=1695997 RepID=A0A2R8B0W9_9RHOB|nr:CbiX/SirB N-terminal domain-containing protein [Pseudoprimorskyibacter insulae]SPF81867.1 hypothetical protein PRI8871_03693 [Pseudoprimorskyibacter insulae]